MPKQPKNASVSARPYMRIDGGQELAVASSDWDLPSAPAAASSSVTSVSPTSCACSSPRYSSPTAPMAYYGLHRWISRVAEYAAEDGNHLTHLAECEAEELVDPEAAVQAAMELGGPEVVAQRAIAQTREGDPQGVHAKAWKNPTNAPTLFRRYRMGHWCRMFPKMPWVETSKWLSAEWKAIDHEGRADFWHRCIELYTPLYAEYMARNNDQGQQLSTEVQAAIPQSVQLSSASPGPTMNSGPSYDAFNDSADPTSSLFNPDDWTELAALLGLGMPEAEENAFSPGRTEGLPDEVSNSLLGADAAEPSSSSSLPSSTSAASFQIPQLPAAEEILNTEDLLAAI